MADIEVAVASLQTEVKTIFKAMDKIDKRVEATEKMVSSIDKLALSVENMTKTMTKMEQKVDNLAEEPAEKWRKLSWLVITLVAGAVFGAVLARIGIH